MRRLLERWLMFVIILAMPLQGLAAATMFHCGAAPAGAHDAAASPGHTHADPVAPHHHQGAAPDGHHGHAAAAATDEAANADLQAPLSKCSACASCCTAGALPSAPMVIASPELPQSFTAPAATRVEPFVTHGLERPPRSFLA